MDSLITRVSASPDGISSLSEPKRLYYTVALLRNEINNGGFHQYFFNRSGSYYIHIEAGLQLLGATQTLELLHKAKEITFPDVPVPTDSGTRRDQMFALEGSKSALLTELEELDQRFYSRPDDITLPPGSVRP